MYPTLDAVGAIKFVGWSSPCWHVVELWRLGIARVVMCT